VPKDPFRQQDCGSDKAMTQRSADKADSRCGDNYIRAAKCCLRS